MEFIVRDRAQMTSSRNGVCVCVWGGGVSEKLIQGKRSQIKENYYWDLSHLSLDYNVN